MRTRSRAPTVWSGIWGCVESLSGSPFSSPSAPSAVFMDPTSRGPPSPPTGNQLARRPPADPLRRPLKLPRIAPGEPCPRTSGGRPNPGELVAGDATRRAKRGGRVVGSSELSASAGLSFHPDSGPTRRPSGSPPMSSCGTTIVSEDAGQPPAPRRHRRRPRAGDPPAACRRPEAAGAKPARQDESSRDPYRLVGLLSVRLRRGPAFELRRATIPRFGHRPCSEPGGESATNSGL